MHGPGRPFPELPPSTSLAGASRLFDETQAARNAYIAGLSDADLLRTVQARPRPDVLRTFRLGETMLQLCTHGTHHRAQAVNMLRRLSVKPPGLDLVLKIRAGE